MKLNQVIAIEKGVKSRVYSELTEANKLIQKHELFTGLAKRYVSLDEENGEKLPPENKKVQQKVSDILAATKKSMTEFFDITAAKDWANTHASADVKVGDETILRSVPVTYLLFLEKQLNDLSKFIDNLPELDEAQEWSKDAASGLYKTPEIETHRSKKVVKPIVKYDATKEHPAQTDLIQVDVLEGYWKKTDHSGAISKTEKRAMLERAEALIKAVKCAREEANGEDASIGDIGGKVFDYLGF